MEGLIEKYIKKDDKKVLHKLRIQARRELAKLEAENKEDLGLKALLKNSSKLRDSDVLLKICKKRKIKKFLKKRHKKLREKFISFLKEFKREVAKKEDVNINKEILKETFLNKDDKTLHKIRIEVKKLRYLSENKLLKKIQDYLGLAHDYYKCEKLMKKFNFNPQKIIKKKKKFIKKAEKERLKFISQL